MRLAGAGVAERNDVLAPQNIFAACEFEHEHLVQAWDDREVERVEALGRREPGLADPPFDNPPLSVDEFQFNKPQKITGVINPITGTLTRHLVVLAQHRRQL